jgi:hypothetical protein
MPLSTIFQLYCGTQDFVPIFIDEFNQTFINKSYEVCGGSSDQYKACIFDYLVVSPEIKLNWRRLHKFL